MKKTFFSFLFLAIIACPFPAHATVTDFYVVGPADFTAFQRYPVLGTGPIVLMEQGGGDADYLYPYSNYIGSDFWQIANAPIHVPSGSTLTSMRCWLWDNSSLTPYTYSAAYLVTHGITASGTFLEWAHVQTANGAITGWQDLSTPLNIPVDNANVSYTVMFYTPDASCGESCAMKGCRITYTHP